MAADPKQQTTKGTGAVPAPSKNSMQAEFDSTAGDEVFNDRPIIKFNELGDDARAVTGWLVCEETLKLPEGSKRANDEDTWQAFVFHLTKPTNSLDRDGKVVEVKTGQEVFIGVNPKNAALRKWLGQPVMHEVIIIGNGAIPMKGRNDMWDFKFKITATPPKERTGAFLVGGPGAKSLGIGTSSDLGAALNDINTGVRETVPANSSRIAAP